MSHVKTKSDLDKNASWADLEMVYYGHLSLLRSGECMEEHGARDHTLHEKLPSLQKFWRCHVAPATNRPDGTYLADGIKPVISLMAERSYEVWCNVVDALDEYAEVKRQVDRGELKSSRYRKCFSLLRFAGDALQLFDQLQFVIEAKSPYEDSGLARRLRKRIVLFSRLEWKMDLKPERDRAICYRNMLVHHGRPWLCFKGQEFEGMPYILRPEHFPVGKQTYLTWGNQRRMFEKEPENFFPLSEACRVTLRQSIEWLEKVYSCIVKELEPFLDDRNYRSLWGSFWR